MYTVEISLSDCYMFGYGELADRAYQRLCRIQERVSELSGRPVDTPCLHASGDCRQCFSWPEQDQADHAATMLALEFSHQSVSVERLSDHALS